MNPSWQKLIDGIIAAGVLKTPRIIEAFKTIDRKDFVLPEYESEAYGDYPLPIGAGQTISQPYTVAFMLELLQPAAGQKILDVGSGSGWVTALLAQLVAPQSPSPVGRPTGLEGRVVAIERIPELYEFGKKNVAKYNFLEKGIVRMLCQDATAGIPEEAPFDKIIAAAALQGRAPRAVAASRELPEAWREELKMGGMIVAPIGGSIWRFSKKSESEWKEEEFKGFAFVPLLTDDKQQITGNPFQKSSVSIGRPIDTDDEKNDHIARIKQRRGLWSAIIAFFISVVLSYITYAVFAPLKFGSAKIDVEIKDGAGVTKIAEAVKDKKLVRSKWLFVGWAALSGGALELRAGSYRFESSVTIPEIVKRLSSGEQFPNERIITIPEGWAVKDIAEYLESEGVVTKEDFLNAEKKTKLAARFPFLKERPSALGLEGYLFPDTYRIFRSANAKDIIIKMLENFQEKITAELLAEISRQKKTLFQIITMASLIEKEVPHEEDRPVISGILWKRFEIGMGLQVDATISYITGKKSTRITAEELAIDSPYNTYKYRGLPVGPIANPGLSAIRAAIYPKASPYLYYLSTPEGKTIFSKTLEEHNAAKAKYLK